MAGNALLVDIDHARMSGQPIIVFTKYTDTLNHLRDRLTASYGPELATFTGAGGHWYAKPVGAQRTTKQELVEAVRSAKVTVLLCTDAASEGLNLQAAGKLINYDLLWNPMRVEQRIGRIDRIRQPAPVGEIVNYTISGTAEEDVYRALAQRIDLFDGLVGQLQPILGAVENSFKAIYRRPRSERPTAVKAQLAVIDARRKELAKGGVSFDDHAAAFEVPHEPPAFNLEQLAHTLRDELRIDLDQLPHPTTADPNRASRDAAGWRALATLGHPDLGEGLDAIAAGDLSPSLQIAESAVAVAVARADRSPPELVDRLDQLDGLQAAVSVGCARPRRCPGANSRPGLPGGHPQVGHPATTA